MNYIHKILISILTIFTLIIFIFYLSFEYNYYDSLISYIDLHNSFPKKNEKLITKHDNLTVVNYAAGKLVYYKNRDLLNQSLHDHGIDRIFTYTPSDIDFSFYQKNSHILDQPKGAGYWLWKPYIILDAMKRLPENSLILYLDGDMLMIDDITPLSELMSKHDRVFFYNSHQNLPYIKKDAYLLMGLDPEQYKNHTHLFGFFILLKNNAKNKQFITTWLNYCLDERILTDIPSTLGTEYQEFKSHRHEQAILSLLAAQYSQEDQLILDYETKSKFFTSLNNRSMISFIATAIKYYEIYNKQHQDDINKKP
jgi:hypothetical protein